jgi:hypothetical protein
MISLLHSRAVCLLLLISGFLAVTTNVSAQRIGYGWCYACNAYMPEGHDCVGFRTRPTPGYDPPVAIPQTSQAELDARRALDWYNDSVRDIDAYERNGSIQSLRSAMEKLFKASALLRSWSPNQARYLKLVKKNLAWCYNAYGRINYESRHWDEAEKYFRMALNYNPDSEAYRTNLRNVDKARETDQVKSIDNQARAAYARGNALWDTGDWEKIANAYDEALRLAKIAASMGGDPVWDGYQKARDKARTNHEVVLAANEKMRAAEAERQRQEQEAAEKHRQEVAVLTERTREYTRKQTDLRDAVAKERRQQAAEQFVEVKNPFGVDATADFQGQSQSGTIGREQKAYDQLWALANHLKGALAALPLDEKEAIGDNELDRIGYLLQQGQNAMNGGFYREPGTPGDKLTPIDPQKMEKLRARMEKVVPMAVQQYTEVKAAKAKQQETYQRVEEAKAKVQTTREEVTKAAAKVAEIKAMPEPPEPEAKKKRSSLLAEALALEAAATGQVKEAEKSQAEAEKAKGEAEVDLVKKREAWGGTRALLNTVIAGGELPEEKNKGGNAPPPPPPPGGKP